MIGPIEFVLLLGFALSVIAMPLLVVFRARRFLRLRPQVRAEGKEEIDMLREEVQRLTEHLADITLMLEELKRERFRTDRT